MADERASATGRQDASDETVRRLQEELEGTRAQLRTAHEELRAARQELQSSNRELQSVVTARQSWEQRQHLLLGELTHRVKNALTVVQAITHQTLRSGGTAESFVARLDGRLAALASAHSLLVESNWRGADLATLAANQLAPYVSDDRNRLKLEGEQVSLPTDLATPFGLILHELATNAAKYGSLSLPGGTVRLSWNIGTRNSRRILVVEWMELGGPVVTPPKISGLGSTLIDKGIPNATVHRDYRAEGMVCTIELPAPEAFDRER